MQVITLEAIEGETDPDTEPVDGPASEPSEPSEPEEDRDRQALSTDVRRIVDSYRQAGRILRARDPVGWAQGLTMAQLRVLFILGRSGPISVGEVAAEMGVSQPTATETLDRLVRAGLVERTSHPADRRVVRNALTAKGREMIDRPWETRRALLASALRGASPHEREVMARGLELLCDALERAVGEERDERGE